MKIDRSLLRGISENIEGAAILVAIITVGHLAEMVVVAVGVESETQLAFLQEQNCDEVQGFLFCQPLPSPAMSEYLRNYQKPDQLSAS
jgi:EAL domain-containing protein (putative c-di-GMP-specific phosphodiesterase class I)